MSPKSMPGSSLAKTAPSPTALSILATISQPPAQLLTKVKLVSAIPFRPSVTHQTIIAYISTPAMTQSPSMVPSGPASSYSIAMAEPAPTPAIAPTGHLTITQSPPPKPSTSVPMSTFGHSINPVVSPKPPPLTSASSPQDTKQK